MGDLDPYLEEIGEFDLLTKDQELRLIREAQTGNIRSRNSLVEANLRLVVHLAKRFRGLGLEMADLIQEGNKGLIHAVGGYKEEFNTRFSTYAGPWIREFIQRAVNAESSTTRLPEWMRTLIGKYQKALLGMAGASFEEVCDSLNLPQKTRASLKAGLEEHGEVNENFEDKELFGIPDPFPLPEEEIAEEDENANLHRKVDALPEDQRIAITGYYFEGKTYDQIAETLHLSRASAVKRCQDAIKTLSLQVA